MVNSVVNSQNTVNKRVVLALSSGEQQNINNFIDYEIIVSLNTNIARLGIWSGDEVLFYI